MEKEPKTEIKPEKKGKFPMVIIVFLLIIIALLVGWMLGNGTFSSRGGDQGGTPEPKGEEPVQEETVTKDETTNNEGVKVYGQIDFSTRAISVNGELYIITTNGIKLDDSCDNELLNGATSCSNSAFTAKKVGITTTDVLDVNVVDKITTKDASSDVFVIYNDGSVKMLVRPFDEAKTVFSSYKVKSVSESCGSTDVNGNCSAANYVLTLQDGSTKTVNSLD